ncbi:hypothetical protein EYF80_005848 [Liparis tanakae]|uniref:Uncharacterized protein n=1 Tax=Liparis tanakae TaxID=230148 RepID=A0A4Z2J1T3_9TELE|nr:hypothetical protein EYF80_005848 [Liparis tanakae]
MWPMSSLPQAQGRRRHPPIGRLKEGHLSPACQGQVTSRWAWLVLNRALSPILFHHDTTISHQTQHRCTWTALPRLATLPSIRPRKARGLLRYKLAVNSGPDFDFPYARVPVRYTVDPDFSIPSRQQSAHIGFLRHPLQGTLQAPTATDKGGCFVRRNMSAWAPSVTNPKKGLQPVAGWRGGGVAGWRVGVVRPNDFMEETAIPSLQVVPST